MISVAVPKEDASCQVGSYIPLPGPDGYISSNYDAWTMGMPKSCSWQLQADPGQHINITFINFQHYNQPTKPSGYVSQNRCLDL